MLKTRPAEKRCSHYHHPLPNIHPSSDHQSYNISAWILLPFLDTCIPVPVVSQCPSASLSRRQHPCNFHTTVTAWWYCVRHNHKSNWMQTGCRIKSVSPLDSPVTAQQQYAYNCNLGPAGRTGLDRGDLQYEIVNIICHKFSLSLVRADMVSVTIFNVYGLNVQLTCFN